MTNEDDYHIVIEPDYINIIYPQEAITDPLVWTALMWGGRRDLNLVRRLSRFNNLTQLENSNIAITSQGIIRGTNKKRYKELLDRRVLETTNFPKGTLIHLKKEDLPINQDPYAERARLEKIGAFNLPQLIIKQSWLASQKRFRAALTEADSTDEGIICSGSYLSVHIPQEFASILEVACLTYNSKLAVYYLLLSSASFAAYRPKVNVKDLRQVPLPKPQKGLLQDIKTINDVDLYISEVFDLKNSESVLIQDIVDYTLF
jgi:hypothetical protein